MRSWQHTKRLESRVASPTSTSSSSPSASAQTLTLAARVVALDESRPQSAKLRYVVQLRLGMHSSFSLTTCAALCHSLSAMVHSQFSAHRAHVRLDSNTGRYDDDDAYHTDTLISDHVV